MSYRASGVTRAGLRLTEAELAEGYRRLPVHGWKASSTNGASTETIDGSETQVISTDFASVTLVCNGTSWSIV
jgi:hypothetical protein